MDLNKECPFEQYETHKSRGGCMVYCDPNTNILMHQFKSLNTSVGPNGQPLFEFLNERHTWPIFLFKNCHYAFSLNQRMALEVSLDFTKCVYINNAIKTPSILLNLFRSLLDLFDEIIYASLNSYGKELYLSKNSMSDIIIEDNKYSFLRPVLFHDNEYEYYRSVQSLFKKLYRMLIENIKENNSYIGKIETSKRNIVNCTLDQHKSGRILQDYYSCGEYSCNNKCAYNFENEDHLSDRFQESGNNLRAIPDRWCYGLIPKKMLEKDREKIYEFQCIYEKNLPKLHFELFDRDERMHRLMCCPKVLLCSEWYKKMKLWITEKQQNLNEKVKLKQLNEIDNLDLDFDQ